MARGGVKQSVAALVVALMAALLAFGPAAASTGSTTQVKAFYADDQVTYAAVMRTPTASEDEAQARVAISDAAFLDANFDGMQVESGDQLTLKPEYMRMFHADAGTITYGTYNGEDALVIQVASGETFWMLVFVTSDGRAHGFEDVILPYLADCIAADRLLPVPNGYTEAQA